MNSATKACITACASGKAWASALQLLSGMSEVNLQANVVTCNAAISACDWVPVTRFYLTYHNRDL